MAAAQSGSATTQPKSAMSTAASDSVITARVKASFVNDARLKGADISVSTVNGIVILHGSAPTSDARGTAGYIAQSTAGVGGVNNNIQTPSMANNLEKNTKQAVKKTERVVSDSWITTKVKSALLANSITKGLKISVSTTNHVVTLSGAIYTQEAIDRAMSLALQIQGVASVNADGLTIVSN
ncbi:BON domain-containing protein [Perlucidibaca aquatica]|uniref:BON domain-containing protein n=1 Tax=Perlucidibaca aquatica TaxID=1852776 RepID=UPI00083B847C|nr:BON domain-containing protein [Perlucidibaca aquatica]